MLHGIEHQIVEDNLMPEVMRYVLAILDNGSENR